MPNILDSSFLQKASTLTNRITGKLNKISKDLDIIESQPQYQEPTTTTIDRTVIDSIVPELMKILNRNLVAALQETKEYTYPELYSRIIDVFSKPDILEFIILNNKIVVNIKAKEVAGTIEDFEAGIQAARKIYEAEGNYDPKDLLGNSYRWIRFIYGPAREGKKVFRKVRSEKRNRKSSLTNKDITQQAINRYQKIIEDRLSAFGDKAPYWYLINYGNAGRVGAYPKYSATNFIEKTEAEINAKLKELSLPTTSQELEQTTLEPITNSIDSAAESLANLELEQTLTKLETTEQLTKTVTKGGSKLGRFFKNISAKITRNRL